MRFEKPVQVEMGWYVNTIKCTEYLHSDLELRGSAQNERGNYTGYFATKWEALAAIREYYNLHNIEEKKMYKITNSTNDTFYNVRGTEGSARVFIENTLDLSLNWRFDVIRNVPKPSEFPRKFMWVHYKTINELSQFSPYFDNIITSRGVANQYAFATNKPLGSSREKIIKHNDDGDILCNKQKLKLGRVIQAIAGDDLKPEEIENIVSKWKSKYEVDTSLVETSDDIGWVYNMDNCGGSCMAYHGEYYKMVEDMHSSIAYLRDGTKLVARALIHKCVRTDTGEELVIMDRIFYDDEKSKLTLQKWRREQPKMTRFQFLEDVPIRGKYEVDCEYDYVPYMDTLLEMRLIEDSHYLCNTYCTKGYYVDSFQQTGGSSDDGAVAGLGENGVWCEDIGEVIHRDDAYYCETDQDWYGSYDELCKVNYAHYRTDDEDIAFDEYHAEYAMLEDLTWIECDDIYVSNTEGYMYCDIGAHEDRWIADSDAVSVEEGVCHIDDATRIVDEEIYVYHTDGYFEHDDGDFYSYPEEGEELTS